MKNKYSVLTLLFIFVLFLTSCKTADNSNTNNSVSSNETISQKSELSESINKSYNFQHPGVINKIIEYNPKEDEFNSKDGLPANENIVLPALVDEITDIQNLYAAKYSHDLYSGRTEFDYSETLYSAKTGLTYYGISTASLDSKIDEDFETAKIKIKELFNLEPLEYVSNEKTYLFIYTKVSDDYFDDSITKKATAPLGYIVFINCYSNMYMQAFMYVDANEIPELTPEICEKIILDFEPVLLP